MSAWDLPAITPKIARNNFLDLAEALGGLTPKDDLFLRENPLSSRYQNDTPVEDASPRGCLGCVSTKKTTNGSMLAESIHRREDPTSDSLVNLGTTVHSRDLAVRGLHSSSLRAAALDAPGPLTSSSPPGEWVPSSHQPVHGARPRRVSLRSHTLLWASRGDTPMPLTPGVAVSFLEVLLDKAPGRWTR